MNNGNDAKEEKKQAYEHTNGAAAAITPAVVEGSGAAGPGAQAAALPPSQVPPEEEKVAEEARTSNDPELFEKADDLMRLNLLCPICRCIASSVVETSCGHLFCHACLAACLASKNECPVCRSEIASARKWHSAPAFQRLVDDHTMRCVYPACAWKGRHGDLHEHLRAHCTWVVVSCPHCAKLILKRLQSAHEQVHCRKIAVPCRHCAMKTAKEGREAHEARCPRAPAECRNKCGETALTRGTLEHHLSAVCAKRHMTCPLAPLGCLPTLFSPAERSAHMRDQAYVGQHVQILMERAALADIRLADLERQHHQLLQLHYDTSPSAVAALLSESHPAMATLRNNNGGAGGGGGGHGRRPRPLPLAPPSVGPISSADSHHYWPLQHRLTSGGSSSSSGSSSSNNNNNHNTNVGGSNSTFLWATEPLPGPSGLMDDMTRRQLMSAAGRGSMSVSNSNNGLHATTHQHHNLADFYVAATSRALFGSAGTNANNANNNGNNNGTHNGNNNGNNDHTSNARDTGSSSSGGGGGGAGTLIANAFSRTSASPFRAIGGGLNFDLNQPSSLSSSSSSSSSSFWSSHVAPVLQTVEMAREHKGATESSTAANHSPTTNTTNPRRLPSSSLPPVPHVSLDDALLSSRRGEEKRGELPVALAQSGRDDTRGGAGAGAGGAGGVASGEREREREGERERERERTRERERERAGDDTGGVGGANAAGVPSSALTLSFSAPAPSSATAIVSNGEASGTSTSLPSLVNLSVPVVPSDGILLDGIDPSPRRLLHRHYQTLGDVAVARQHHDHHEQQDEGDGPDEEGPGTHAGWFQLAVADDSFWENLQLGHLVDALDVHHVWYLAEIIDAIPGSEYRVSYIGWPSHWDKWEEYKSPHITPPKTHHDTIRRLLRPGVAAYASMPRSGSWTCCSSTDYSNKRCLRSQAPHPPPQMPSQ